MHYRISRVFRNTVFLSIILTLLNACSLQSPRYPAALSLTTKGAAEGTAVQFLPLIAAIVLLLAAIGIAYYFFSRGDLKKWVNEGSAIGRSKLDQTRFKNQKRRTEAEELEILRTLGHQTWDARVSDPSYADEYGQLEALQTQAGPMEEVVKAVQLELARARDARNKLNLAYDQKMKELQVQLNQMNDSVSLLKSEQSKAVATLRKADEQKQALENEAHGYESRIVNLQGSDLPDKDSQIAGLNNSIATLGKTIYALGDQINGLTSQTQKLAAEQGPYLVQIDNLKSQMDQATNEHKDSLLPLDQQVSNLDNNLKTRQAELTAVKEQMTPVIESLGPKVYAARPDSPALQDSYQKLDIKKEQLSSATQGFDLANSRLVSRDKEMLRNFIIMVAIGVLVVVLLILLLILAF
jgi:DNA repair exonuclease SbcCD ATPase subunit